MALPAAAVATIATGAAQSGLTLSGNIMANAANKRSQERQMKFQSDLSNTAHQREVADLRSAGLNPILSATGGNGASSPPGASFTAENPMRGTGEAIQNAILAANTIKVSKADIDQKEAAVELIKGQLQTNLTQQNLNSAMTARELSGADLNKALSFKAAAEADATAASAAAIRVGTINAGLDVNKKDAQNFWYKVPFLGKIMGAADWLQKFIPTAPSHHNEYNFNR